MSKAPALQKFSGAGNTFVVIKAILNSSWLIWEKSQIKSRTELAKKICSKLNGADVDGVLFLEVANRNADYKWDFYNSDGSHAEMCGNAARCAALFLLNEEKKQKSMFETAAGPIETKIISDNKVEVIMPPQNASVVWKQINVEGTNYSGLFINTGVPHFVIEQKDLSTINLLKSVSKKIRNNDSFGSTGTNVTWVQLTSDKVISAITFERGVEDYTLACGTGAVAAAHFLFEKNKQSEVQVQMPGGILEVKISSDTKRGDILVGPVEYIAELDLNLESL